MTADQPLPRARSFSDLLREAVAERGGSLAVVDSETRWSWAELAEHAGALAAAFASAGLEPGDRIAIQAPTSADFVSVYLGALQAGLVTVPVNPAYTVVELDHIISDSGARMLVTASVAALEAADRLRADHAALEHIVVAARSGVADLPTVHELTERGRAAPPIDRAGTGEDLAVLLYTSGTSGRPKAAMLPVRALLANLAQVAALEPAPVSSADRVFLPLPMFHVFGLNAGLGLALYFKATLVLAAKFDAEASLHTMAREQISVVIGAPLEFAVWMSQDGFDAGFSAVRFALSGSAPLTPDLVGHYQQRGVALFEGYGLTEAAPVVTLNMVPDTSSGAVGGGWAEPKAGSIGRPLPGVEVQLIDVDGEPVEPGDLGVLEVRGPNLFTGYWPDGADGPGSDGWFATGDLAVADDDGDYYLVGRRSDLILVNGFNVYPAEVEAVLKRVPGVREVAVLGEPDAETGEAVIAYVVADAGATVDAEDLIAEAGRSLARFKLPKRVVEVTALPHTATGKVMKWRLRSASGVPGAVD